MQPFVDTGLMVAIGIIMEEETTTERERPYITGKKILEKIKLFSTYIVHNILPLLILPDIVETRN